MGLFLKQLHFLKHGSKLFSNSLAGYIVWFSSNFNNFYFYIKFPYTAEDLIKAGVHDPAELEIFTYNASTLSWGKMQLDSVDCVNSLLICKADHFSMFTTGISASPTVISSLNSNSGGCFITITSNLFRALKGMVVIVLLFLIILIGLYISRRTNYRYSRKFKH